MRDEVQTALRSLSDVVHQQTKWGKHEAGVNYYDDLTLNIHILYDDCRVLPHPEVAVPAVLRSSETPAFLTLESVLGPLLDELRDRPDHEYPLDARWPAVVQAAADALRVMESSKNDMVPQ